MDAATALVTLKLLTCEHDLLTLATIFSSLLVPVQLGLLSPAAVQVLSIFQHPTYSCFSFTMKPFLMAWIHTEPSFLNPVVCLVFPTYIGTYSVMFMVSIFIYG